MQIEATVHNLPITEITIQRAVLQEEQQQEVVRVLAHLKIRIIILITVVHSEMEVVRIADLLQQRLRAIATRITMLGTGQEEETLLVHLKVVLLRLTAVVHLVVAQVVHQVAEVVVATVDAQEAHVSTINRILTRKTSLLVGFFRLTIVIRQNL